MPRSVFLGRRSPLPGEALWTDDDRAWAEALYRLEKDECKGCGLPLSQTLDPAFEEAFTVDEFTAGCAACYVLATKRNEMPPNPKRYRARLRDRGGSAHQLS